MVNNTITMMVRRVSFVVALAMLFIVPTTSANPQQGYGQKACGTIAAKCTHPNECCGYLICDSQDKYVVQPADFCPPHAPPPPFPVGEF